MSFQLISLIVLVVAAAAVASYAIVAELQRRQLVARSRGALADGTSRRTILIDGQADARLAARLRKLAPKPWVENKDLQAKLVRAGWDGAAAPYVYSLARLASLVLFPLLAIAFLPRTDPRVFVGGLLYSLLVGVAIPTWYLNRKERLRQETIRRAIPDALDLLVVCVEAGVSLDAAILRVAREIELPHPELSKELLIVNRKVNAGVTREEALRGLWVRTGVDDVRALVSNMIQSEKWGTSVAKVLRVYAETLRRKRRQAAEKKAATAPTKMMIPLAFLILPAMFAVTLGPAMLNVLAWFRGEPRQ